MSINLVSVIPLRFCQTPHRRVLMWSRFGVESEGEAGGECGSKQVLDLALVLVSWSVRWRY